MSNEPANTGAARKRACSGFKPHCSWRELFLSVSLLRGYARIAITPATDRPVHGAAIAGVLRDEGALRQSPASVTGHNAAVGEQTAYALVTIIWSAPVQLNQLPVREDPGQSY